MSEAAARPRWRKWGRYFLFLAALGVLALGGLAWYVSTESFQAMVRRRFVSEVERATGGRVEVGAIHAVPFRFVIDIRDLIIHGREAAGEAPYVRVDRVVAQVKVISIFSQEFGFNSIVFDHPLVHLITYPDGTINQPEPKLGKSSQGDTFQQLLALSIGYLEVRHGELLWNDQHMPLDFAVRDVSADMSYSLLHRRYQGNVLLGKGDAHYDNLRPFAWMLEMHFVLGPSWAEISSLKWSSGRSRLDGSGRISDFRNPKLEGNYSATLDLGEAGAIARRRDLQAGILQLEGKGTWSWEDFSSSGKLLLKDFQWQDERLKLRSTSAKSQYAVTRERLTLTQLQGRLLGGSVSGDADVVEWLSLVHGRQPQLGKRPPEPKGTVRLRANDISLAVLADALTAPALPLSRMKPAGAADAVVDAHWQGNVRNLEADIAVDVAPPAVSVRDQLPLTAHTRARYHSASQSLDLAELSVSTRASQLRASGVLSSSSSVKVGASTTDLSEWQPLITALHGPASLPVQLRGRATFTGTATGNLSSVMLAGSLQAEDFDSLVATTAGAPEKRVHWDSLNVNLQLSPQHFAARNGVLRHGHARVGFEASAALQNWRFVDQSSFTLHLDIHDADVGELQALAGTNYPLSGTLNLTLEAGGARADPRGEGHLQLVNGAVYGEPIERFTSDLRVGGGEGQLNNIDLVHYHGRVAGALAYTPSTRAFRFNLTGSNFDLAHMPSVQATRVLVEGRMEFSARGAGTLDEPAINANIRLYDLAFDHERAGDFTFEAVTQGPEMHLTGRSQFNQAELLIDGNIHLRDNWPADIGLRFNRLDADALLRTYLRGRVTGHSAFAGELRVRGPLREPRQLDVSGNLSQLFVDIDNIKLNNDGPVRFVVSRQLLDIQQLHLIGDGTDLTAQGEVQLGGERRMDLRAQGYANLQLIQTLYPSFASSGMVTLSMTVGGTLSQPAAQGRLQIENGAVSYAELPSSLSEINGTLLFNQDRLHIESLTARTGGGTVNLGGDVTSYGGQLNFSLTAHADGVRLRYPPGVSSTANGDLRLAGNTNSALLSGDVTVTKLAMTPGFDFGLYLARSKQSAIMPQTNTFLNQVRLDIHLTTTPELQMQTALAKLSGDADLHLRGTVARPSVLGRVDILEGEIYFNGTKYRLERGDITFSNPVTITPAIDLQATTQIRDYEITVNLNGQLDKLRAKWRSEPPLPEADIIALLALGRTQEESAQLQASGQSSFSQETSNAILGEALNATVSNRAQRLFGVSRIKIDPQGLSTETNPNRGPQVTIEQQVTDKVTVTYSTNVSQASQQIIQLEYNVTRNIAIVGVRDQNGVVSFDVRIRQRKK